MTILPEAIQDREYQKFVRNSDDDVAMRTVTEATDLDIRDLDATKDSVECIQDTHDDLNCNANTQQGDTDVSTSNPLQTQIGDGTNQASVIQAADDTTDLDDEYGVTTNSILNARISNTEIRPLRADRSTNTLQTINYEHHEIHAGCTFRVQHNQDNIPTTGSGGELVIAFHVPDQTKEPHIIWEFVHQGDMTMKVLEGVTFNASAGSDLAPKNSNRNSATTSVLQGKATGSLVSDYVTVGENSADSIYSGGSVISLKRNYVIKNSAGEGARRQEVILKTNTNYAFVLDNNETTTQGGQIRLEWYEHSAMN